MKLTNISILLSLLTLCFSSCVSSEIIDGPESSEQASNEIVLHLSAPESANTRATNHEDYKLRYVVKLFSDNFGTLTLKERKDICEGEVTDNEVIFTAPTGNYHVMIFADYIPKNSQKNGEIYPDCFYDTSSKNVDIKLKKEIDNYFFNNDNLDCFSDHEEFEKEEVRKDIKKLSIPRAVAKVRFVDNDKNSSDDLTIKITTHTYFKEFHQSTQVCAGRESEPISNLELESLNNNDGELFYFYTFATTNNYNLGEMKFEVTKEGFNPKEVIIKDAFIPVQRNYITTVTGKFIPATETDNPSKEDPDSEDKDDTYIHVYSQANQNFNEPDKDISVTPNE